MILAAVLATAAVAAAPTPPATAAPQACCFVNAAYVGTCVVVPTEKETCEAILAYLNSPTSTGKTYCNSTRLRGRWKAAPCATRKPAGAALTGGGPAAAGAAEEPLAAPLIRN